MKGLNQNKNADLGIFQLICNNYATFNTLLDDAKYVPNIYKEKFNREDCSHLKNPIKVSINQFSI